MKELLGLIATAIAIVGFILYIRSVFHGKTKPHAFTWLVWAVLSGIAFAVQFVERAGPGSWATLVGTIGCLAILILALWKGTRQFTAFDWVCLFLALLGIALWVTTKVALTAAILVTLADAIGYIPTYIKGFAKPFEEHIALYAIGIIIPLFSIPAIEHFVLANWLYPASLIVTNVGFVTMILIRRRALRAGSIAP